jgi:hypothetical protein
MAVALLVVPVLHGADGDPKKDAAPDKKDAPGLREAEVRFADGSTVRVLLMQETLDVTTKYGKLKVPTTEIRRIDFGIHMPEDVTKQVADAIARLASDTFNQREAAGKDLVALGANAYPALKAAARSGDPEVAQRAVTVIEKIKEKVPASQLRTKVEDAVVTNEFPIQGLIANSTIKVRTAYFGDLDLKVTELRSIRWTAGNSEAVDLLVDATKCSQQEMSQWLDTGMTVDTDSQLSITASGTVNLRDGAGPQFSVGPAGSRQFQRNGGGVYPPGALLGKIGEAGQTFVIGEKFEGALKQEGKLFLQIAPSPWEQVCTGNFRLKISGAHKEGGQ